MKNKKLSSLLFHVFCLLLSLTMLYPILWLLSSSFKPNADVFIDAASLIPKNFTVENYGIGWRGFGGITFGTFFKNSFIVAGIATIGAVFSSSLVAYGFARINFKGKRILFTCMMLSMMLPGQILMVPQYILFNQLGWVNSFKPLIVPSFLGSIPFFVFLIMQFIQGIPYEMDEAAIVDGCNKYNIFTRIMLPLIKPALVTVTIFSFYWKWEDFLGPLLYLNQAKSYPVSLALKLFADPGTVTNWSAMFAMSALSLVPVFAIFFIFQRYIVEGISTSGLKG